MPNLNKVCHRLRPLLAGERVKSTPSLAFFILILFLQLSTLLEHKLSLAQHGSTCLSTYL
jgi:hypothetical protein